MIRRSWHSYAHGFHALAQFWRRCRRLAQTMFTKEACATYLPVQQAEATQLMYDLLNEPEVRSSHVNALPVYWHHVICYFLTRNSWATSGGIPVPS